jgi:protoheme IX farnesyltransferase
VAALPDDLTARGTAAPSLPGVAGAPSRSAGRHLARRIRAYFLLTKPRVIELLLVTTVPAMVLAENGLPALWLIGAVLLGGAMAAGGANTINCWIERDRDQVMRRTHGRPLPQGEVSPTAALVFGLVLEALAFGWLWSTVNLLSATLAVSAMLFYVFVYTIWLKPRSTQNIVIGGAAGAVPVLVGWAAVTGSLAIPAWIMFAIIFFWTPPHFWALSVRYREDYAAAGIPMLPVVRGTEAASRQIVAYTVVVVAVSVTLAPLATLGWVYVAAAVLLGVWFLAKAIQLHRDPSPERAIKLFMVSNTYLALLFAAIAVDTLVRAA